MPRPFSHLARSSASLPYVEYFLENWLLDELAGRLQRFDTFMTPWPCKRPLMSSSELWESFETAPKMGNFMLVTSICSSDPVDAQMTSYFATVLRVARRNEMNIPKTYVRTVDSFLIRYPIVKYVASEILQRYVEREYTK
jgi:hypothetical protein